MTSKALKNKTTHKHTHTPQTKKQLMPRFHARNSYQPVWFTAWTSTCFLATQVKILMYSQRRFKFSLYYHPTTIPCVAQSTQHLPTSICFCVMFPLLQLYAVCIFYDTYNIWPLIRSGLFFPLPLILDVKFAEIRDDIIPYFYIL